MTPTITAVTPSTIGPGTTEVIIEGTGFRDGSQVAISGGVTVTDTIVVSENQITVDVTVSASAPSGPRTVTVYEVGPLAAGHITADSCTACLTVTG